MVSVSHERVVESERRLRAVLSAAEVEHLAGTWCFRRFSGETPAGALATVSGADGWCALIPASDRGTDERFALTVTTFDPVIENSGFVGWLATTIKRRVGSGVIVICGSNPDRGGIFDYLGYPVDVAGAVRELIDELRAGLIHDPFDLDLRLFRVVATSPASAISSETWFEFREHAGVVEASYGGGKIVRGYLIGRREGSELAAAYSQLHTDGQLRSGSNRMRLEQQPDRTLLLIEDYTWSDGTPGRNVLAAVERASDS
jgi:hypothetical protein